LGHGNGNTTKTRRGISIWWVATQVEVKVLLLDRRRIRLTEAYLMKMKSGSLKPVWTTGGREHG
jgi:hypothetical protein